MATILLTGAAGFVGFHLARRLCADGHEVVGVDDLKPLFPALKAERLRRLREIPGFLGLVQDVSDTRMTDGLFADLRPALVVHLAAQTGVRFSVEHPFEYERTNVLGMLSILEAARRHGTQRVVFASSSSVYGNSLRVPWREDDRADAPVSLYAATKRADELMASAFAATHGLCTVGLRYFTVYGPFGRPDMAVWTFADAIANGEPVPLFDGGSMRRDFTYVDDVVEATRLALFDTGLSGASVFNVGAGQPRELDVLLRALETNLGRPAIRMMLPAQAGDVNATWADASALKAAVGFLPGTTLEEGVAAFSRWFLENPDVVDAVRRERSLGRRLVG
jgi:UDP-glucuronate 4-epimerase